MGRDRDGNYRNEPPRRSWPVIDNAPLVADFTSTILSRRIEVSRYGVIYASSGKNLGPAGFAVVIVRSDLLALGSRPQTPSILDWQRQQNTTPISSLYSTPATFAIYVSSLVLQHYLSLGGIGVLAEHVKRRASRIYARIDQSKGFYTNNISPQFRSQMNIPFRIGSGATELEALFVQQAEHRGLHQLFGHPLFGGLRASLYLGVPDQAVDALEEFLDDFRKKYENKQSA